MKISILGGGGTRTPLLVRGLLSLEEELGIKEISLMDVNEERLPLIKKVLDDIYKEETRGAILTYTQDIKVCMEEASFVVCTIRVGGG
ncbi:family 4 glycosyl hydrolase [Candidatus Hakubella thermalkaliphila]|nr:hypothetical protein [Candidatus Hakubella thermalkaliphila]MBT9169321.1 6-phospho-beta-glucosidase BglT [Bacillota bacterium]GFP40556.1 6-phospho-beta-glucosidase [Candidatus Hakubella thermalkaliphila]